MRITIPTIVHHKTTVSCKMSGYFLKWRQAGTGWDIQVLSLRQGQVQIPHQGLSCCQTTAKMASLSIMGYWVSTTETNHKYLSGQQADIFLVLRWGEWEWCRLIGSDLVISILSILPALDLTFCSQIWTDNRQWFITAIICLFRIVVQYWTWM